MVRDAVNNFKKVFPDWELKEDRVIINIKKYGIDGTRIDLAHIDEKAENEPNRVKRHMKMEVAKFMRAVYNEILEEPEKYGLGQNINR